MSLSMLVFCTLCCLSCLNGVQDTLCYGGLTEAMLIRTATEQYAWRKDFFSDIMGVEEDVTFIRYWNYKDKVPYNNFARKFLSVVEREGKKQYILTGKNGLEFQAGYFQELSIGQLREFEKTMPKPGGGSLSVREGYQTQLDSPWRRNLDIGALQAEPANRDAVFQVASNFNALEPISLRDYPEYGITGYIGDYTQSPFAALSAAPGLIYRMYYLFYDPLTEPIVWRQTKEHSLNLLDQVAEYFPVVNGYVDFKHGEVMKPNREISSTRVAKISEKLKQEVLPEEQLKIKIGFHRDIQVTNGLVHDIQHVTFYNPQQLINQVFTAALDLGCYNADFKDNEDAQKRAQILLDAAYEGTLKSAAFYGKKKVFLTLVGGGVFANDLDWIACAIEKNKSFIEQAGLEVILIMYDLQRLINKQGIEKAMTFKARMLALSNETQGSYTCYYHTY